jgi:putative phosphoesterase
MRYLIFTDIHGNMEAFQAVLKAVQKKKVDHYVFLGDLVGYGASPNEVIAKILNLKPLSIIRGNHDKAVSGLDFLVRLKQSPEVIQDSITICHGAPFDEDYYIFGEFDAAEAFSYIQTPVCFFGHTHFPFVYTEKDGNVEGTFLEGNSNEIKLEKGVRYLINPGSVGQPRDRNPRAAFAIYDAEARTIKFSRVEYDIEEAKRKIIEEKLPPALAERLSLGI